MSTSYDAIVFGGGIIGCSIAWRLAQSKRRDAIVEPAQSSTFCKADCTYYHAWKTRGSSRRELACARCVPITC